MPFDTVGGLPPMPSQRLGTTLYQPRQMRTFPHTRPPRTRSVHGPVPTLPGTPAAKPYQQDDGDAWLMQAEVGAAQPKTEVVALPPLPSVRAVAEGAVVWEENPSHSQQPDAFADANLWRYRTTAAELGAEQRLGIYGAAQFRPALMRDDASAAADAVTARKPLLQPYLYAQEIARSAAVETWQVRRSRYLQWLRKDAVKSLESGHVVDGGRAQSVYLGTTMATLAGLAGGEDLASPEGPTRGVYERRQPASDSFDHSPLPTTLNKKALQLAVTSSDSNSVFAWATGTSAHANANAITPAMEGSPVLGGVNASAAAVRRLFVAARAAAAAATGNSAAPTLRNSPAAGRSLSLSSSIGDAISPLTLPGTHTSVPATVISTGAVADAAAGPAPAVAAVAGVDGGTRAAEPHDVAARQMCGDSSPLARSAAREFAGELVAGDAGMLALFGLGDSDSDAPDYASSGKSTVSPPSEYDLAGILRDRMHHTVALFTPSSQGTLEEPPVKQTTHPVLGLARLTPGTATQSVLPPGPQTWTEAHISGLSQHSMPALSQTQAQHFPSASIAGDIGHQAVDGVRSGLPRQMQRLLYEEAYSRGVLCQLAWQSSPTRWYSAQLPTGQEGMQYRLINAPALQSDAAVRQRLQQAMLHAATTIALPRATHMAQQQQQQTVARAASRSRPHHRTRTASFATPSSTTARCPSLPLVDLSTADETRLTVECAASEKEVLFERWMELHVNIAAQLDLLRQEETLRRKLLGEFVSCRHPLPCPCLDCDIEVLRMSAVPLEPTVKPLCLYTSIVLGRHRDILQRELLRRYQAKLDLLHGLFRVGFRALYSYAKLVAEETRRFQQLLHYHEFCLVIAARGFEVEPMSRSGNTQPPEAPDTRQPSPTGPGEPVTPELHTLPDISLGAPVTPRMRASVVQPRDEGMWRLRQRRLRYYAAWDSPFFSYLVYTEMITTASAEAAVRAALQTAEEAEREELKTHMTSEAAFAKVREAEQRARASIVTDCAEAHAAMLSGPVAGLHAALVEERRAERAATYERACEDARLRFVAAAVAEKAAMEAEQLGWYRPYVRELRQRFLSQVVASRSEEESKAASQEWLWRQQHVSLFGSEQRLRDRIALVEQADDFAALAAAAEASRRRAIKHAARREQRETARRQEEAQRVTLEARLAQEREVAALGAQVRRAERIADPSKRPSACMDSDAPNTFDKLAIVMVEDFEAFLPSLTQDAA